jgi:hypothetical protein
MDNLKIEATIDDTPVSQQTLDQVQALRIKHVLHEMKALGASVNLSDSAIDYLPYPEAKQRLLDLKAQYSRPNSNNSMQDLSQRPIIFGIKLLNNPTVVIIFKKVRLNCTLKVLACHNYKLS